MKETCSIHSGTMKPSNDTQKYDFGINTSERMRLQMSSEKIIGFER